MAANQTRGSEGPVWATTLRTRHCKKNLKNCTYVPFHIFNQTPDIKQCHESDMLMKHMCIKQVCVCQIAFLGTCRHSICFLGRILRVALGKINLLSVEVFDQCRTPVCGVSHAERKELNCCKVPSVKSKVKSTDGPGSCKVQAKPICCLDWKLGQVVRRWSSVSLVANGKLDMKWRCWRNSIFFLFISAHPYLFGISCWENFKASINRGNKQLSWCPQSTKDCTLIMCWKLTVHVVHHKDTQ